MHGQEARELGSSEYCVGRFLQGGWGVAEVSLRWKVAPLLICLFRLLFQTPPENSLTGTLEEDIDPSKLFVMFLENIERWRLSVNPVRQTEHSCCGATRAIQVAACTLLPGCQRLSCRGCLFLSVVCHDSPFVVLSNEDQSALFHVLANQVVDRNKYFD